jgi:hypothetical protein
MLKEPLQKPFKWPSKSHSNDQQFKLSSFQWVFFEPTPAHVWRKECRSIHEEPFGVTVAYNSAACQNTLILSFLNSTVLMQLSYQISDTRLGLFLKMQVHYTEGVYNCFSLWIPGAWPVCWSYCIWCCKNFPITLGSVAPCFHLYCKYTCQWIAIRDYKQRDKRCTPDWMILGSSTPTGPWVHPQKIAIANDGSTTRCGYILMAPVTKKIWSIWWCYVPWYDEAHA